MIQIRTNVDMELPNVINVTCFYFREKHFYMTTSLNSVLVALGVGKGVAGYSNWN